MSRPLLPYSLQMASALLGKNEKMAVAVTTEALRSITEDLVAVANKYDGCDLPFVIASMKILTEALSGSLNESGIAIVDSIVKRTTCVGIDMNAFREAMGNGRTEE